MASSETSELWWVPDDHDVYTLANQSGVVLANGLVSFTVHKTKKVVPFPIEKCMRAVKDQGTPEDLIQLPDVNTASILACVRARFNEQKIYTNIGQVLMSVNPFRVINGLYGKSIIKAYEDPMAKNMPSHVYMIPSRAYFDMCTTGRAQSILISGESGAGKTEATKQCLSFLTEVANSVAAAQAQRNEGTVSIADVSERIIAASPILEAFGNAQTLRNPNSSRFGKWMILNFDNNNVIHSANIISYLLEKSRVTQRDNKERNYHIFYQILRGVGRDQLIGWHIDPSTRAHKYLSQGDREAPDFNDAKVYKETFAAFLKMGFSSDDIVHLFKIIMAVLQIGDITFTPTRDGEGSQIASPDTVEQIARKLGVSVDILSYALCNRSIESGKGGKKSVVAVQLNVQKAQETRDSLARFLYDKVFLDIITSINMKSKDSLAASDSIQADRGIGLLDIFGFEIFIENSFEQLCINYCNEMLQNHFNFVIFTAEKQLYDQQGVTCETIEFRDNTDVIREIESTFRSLDEEARIPKGSSKTWFDKLKKVKMQNITFPTKKMGDIFTVRHYAGNVDYNALGFLDKNVETLNNDLLGAMASSVDPVVHRVFANTQQHGDAPVNERRPSTLAPVASAKDGEGKDSKDSGNLSRTRSSTALANRSLSWRFINQLSALMNMLKRTQSHFIRCVKSNDDCAAQRFESSLVYKQLVYSGVFEVVKIQQSGLPCRLMHDDFVERYRCLAPSSVRFVIRSSQELINTLKRCNYDLSMSRVGTTMTFYKSHEQRLLESKRDNLYKRSSTLISRFFQMKTRSYLYRFILRYYKRFDMFNKDLDLQCATDALEHFLVYAQRLNKVERRDMLSHVVAALQHELSLLDRRVQLIQDARDQLAKRDAECVEGLETIVSRAIELTITEHAVIIQCKNVISTYRQAEAFALLVKGPPDGDRRISVLVSNLRALASQQIHDGMDKLYQMTDLIPDAEVILQEISAYKNAVDTEIEQILRPLEGLFERASSAFDSKTGNLVFRYATDGSGSFNKLRRMLSSLRSDTQFKCSDTELLYEDCERYVHIMEDYVFNACDARNAQVELLSYTANRVCTTIFRTMLPEFDQWIEIQLSADKLQELLQQGSIPGNAVDQREVSFQHIDNLLDKLRSLAEPSENVKTVIQVGEWVVKWRKAFLANDWDLLVETVEQADDAGVNFFIFEDFPECIEEMERCQWQAAYNELYNDLVEMITRRVFRYIGFDTESWFSLVESFAEDMEKKEYLEEFATPEDSPKLLEMIPLLDMIIKLRSLTFSKEVEFARQVTEEIYATQTDMMKKYFFYESVKEEIDVCEKLLKKVDYEATLTQCLQEIVSVEYICTKEDAHIPYASLVNLSPAIMKLQDILQQLFALGSTFDSSLQSKIAMGNCLLLGRRFLQMDETDASIHWKDNLKTFQSSVGNLRDDGVDYSICTVEISIILRELHRRLLQQAFTQILTAPTITGQVDVNVAVSTESLSGQFHAFNTHLQLMKRREETTEELSPLGGGVTAYPINLQHLARFTKKVLFLRKYIHDTSDWNHVYLASLLQTLRSCPHGGGRELGNVQREMKLLQEEMTARDAVRHLKHQLKSMQINLHASRGEVGEGDVAPQERPLVDLRPLKEAMAMVSNYPGQATKQVLSLAQKVLSLLQHLLDNHMHLIDHHHMEEILSLYTRLELDSRQIEIIMDHIRTHNFLHSLTTTLTTSSTISPDQLFARIQQIQSSLKSLPDKFLPWLHTSLLYCALSDALCRQSWIEIIEIAQELDDYMHTTLRATVEQMILDTPSSQRTESKFLDAIHFISVCTQYKSFGFDQAIAMKNAQDQQEVARQTSTLSPIDSLKFQIQQEDLLGNLYGVGRLRSAGFTDSEIVKLSFPAKLLWAYSVDVSLLRRQQYPTKDLIQAGYSVGELYRAGYSIGDLYRGGVSVREMIQLGLSLQQLRLGGVPDNVLFTDRSVSIQEIRQVETEPRTLIRLGFDLPALIAAGFSVAELRGAGFTAMELYHAGLRDVQAFLEAGFSSRQLAALFPPQSLVQQGLSYQQLKKAGLRDQDLVETSHRQAVQRQALMALYNAAGGTQWMRRGNWGSRKPLSTWYGVTVQSARGGGAGGSGGAPTDGEGLVLSIDLVDNNLRGYLPEEISLLTGLRRLRLTGNPGLNLTQLPQTLVRQVKESGVVTDFLPFATAHRLLSSPFSSPVAATRSSSSSAPAPTSPLLTVKPEDSRLDERQALLELHRALQGPKWKVHTHWASSLPVDQWHGIRVNKEGYVTEIHLPSNNLRGSLPDAIGSLQHLRVLDLRLNQVSGFLPPGLAYCYQLTHLQLQANKLCGPLPTALGELTDLVLLDVRSNLLQGEADPEIFRNLSKLKYLGLHSNHLVVQKENLQRALPICKIVF